MKLKTSAIALAVAGIVATPMAAQAETYASVRIGLRNVDTGGVSEMTVQGFASRLGFKGETDLGNGMTGFGKYEFSVATDGTTNAAAIGRRHAVVGLKGDFGKVSLGQTYHTFYNHVVGPNDNPWAGSGYAMIAYVGRTDNAISYAGDFGAVSVGVTAYMFPGATATTGNEGIDGTEIGVSFDAGGVKIGLAVQDMDADVDATTGVAVTGIPAGPVSLGVGFQSKGDDTSFLVDAGFGGGYLHYEMYNADLSTASSPTHLTVGYTQSLGRQTTAWYEFQSHDADSAVPDSDTTRLFATLKYDIK